MGRFISLIIGLLIILSGCLPEKQDTSDVIPEPDKNVSSHSTNEREEWIAYQGDPQTFYQTYGWISESEILIAEIEEGDYILRSYNIKTGEKKDIYKETMMVIDTKIHASSEYIALIVSESSVSAIIKVIELNGTLVGEAKIDSSEVYMDWNDEDASLMMITAFYEDWTFDTFVLDLNSGELKVFESQDPFVKWLDSDTLLSLQWMDHALSGGQLIEVDWRSGETKNTGIENVVFFDAYGGKLFTVYPNEQEKEMNYTILGKGGELEAEWSAPALSNYSQWFIPEVQWLTDGTLVTLLPLHDGLLDDTEPEFEFVKVKGSDIVKLGWTVGEAAFSCSPDGTLCLSGYEANHIIQFNPLKEWKWIDVS